jgi:hypothetical protein
MGKGKGKEGKASGGKGPAAAAVVAGAKAPGRGGKSPAGSRGGSLLAEALTLPPANTSNGRSFVDTLRRHDPAALQELEELLDAYGRGELASQFPSHMRLAKWIVAKLPFKVAPDTVWRFIDDRVKKRAQRGQKESA